VRVDDVNDLRLLLASRYPLIVARMDDETRFMTFVRRAADLLATPVWTWSLTRGLGRDGMGTQSGTQDPKQALAFIGELPDPAAFVLLDFVPSLADAAVLRRLKEFALAPKPGQTIVLTGADARVPTALEGIALPWALDPPSDQEVEAMVRRALSDLGDRGLTPVVEDAQVTELVRTAKGLALPEAERLITRAALEGGPVPIAEHVREAKAALLAEDGVLQLVPSDAGGLGQVGGLEQLKEWLRIRGRGFEPGARDFGLEAPRGVLLTGVPGCGKSLIAKTLARTWRLPLVRLDPGAIFGPYVGESEQRLRGALETLQAMAPVVVWIDEIEKGFAAGDGAGDGGVSLRVVGELLRWMQDRPEGVFLVATSNDVSLLPPELLRRGRFDEVFFVDLPTQAERAAILTLHLAQRRRDPAAFDLPAIAAASDGFSGAELEGAIVGALYRAYADGSELSNERIVEELGYTTPLSRTRAEDIARMRAWAEGRAVPASGGIPRGTGTPLPSNNS
jgi:hypothetical protein